MTITNHSDTGGICTQMNTTSNIIEAELISKWAGALILIHTLVLALLIYNTIQFLARQRRYKIVYLSLFYLISISIMALRVAYFVLVVLYLSEWANDTTMCPRRRLNNVDNISVYCDLALGI